MSTIKVVNIQHPDSASPAISLNSDGTASTPGISVPSSINDLSDVNTSAASDGEVLTYSSGSWSPAAAAGGGGLSQVLSVVKTDVSTINTDQNVFTAVPGLSLNITPSSSSSKMLIHVSVSGLSGNIGYAWGSALLFNGSLAFSPTSPGQRGAWNFSGVSDTNFGSDSPETISYTLLHEPQTTSSVTYAVGVTHSVFGEVQPIYINRSRGSADDPNQQRAISSLVIMEVG